MLSESSENFRASVLHPKHHLESLLCGRYVYDGEMEQQMYMLFDGSKKLLAVGDIYPAPQQLAKGDYVLRLLLRHDSPALLEKFRAMPLVRTTP